MNFVLKRSRVCPKNRIRRNGILNLEKRFWNASSSLSEKNLSVFIESSFLIFKKKFYPKLKLSTFFPITKTGHISV